MKYMRRTAGYIWTDYKTNAQIAKELKITPILDKLLEYKRNWIQHVNRMSGNRLPRVTKHYTPTGRRNHGRPLKILLDTWDRNGSTSGPTPWQIYDDDEQNPNLTSVNFDFKVRLLSRDKRLLFASYLPTCLSILLSSCPSVRMFHCGSTNADFHENWYWRLLWQNINKIEQFAYNRTKVSDNLYEDLSTFQCYRRRIFAIKASLFNT